jgi:predicted glycosyltransferase
VPAKLLFYAHNGWGLGHLSRLLKIATILQAEIVDLSILLLTQSSLAHAFRLPPRTEVVKFPGVLQNQDGVISKALPIPFEAITQLRQRIMLATALAYEPHLFLVDYAPVGVRQELLPTLRALKDAPNRPVIVCGLLDLTGPSYVREQWRSVNAMPALEQVYDEIWVYGCQTLFDPIREYQLPDTIAQKVRFCGYLGVGPPARPPDAIRQELGAGQGKLILVTVGLPGWDGFPVLDAYLGALECLPKESEINSILVTGPEMPAEQQELLRQRSRRIVSRSPQTRAVQLIEFSPQLLDIMAASDVVVARGGYNTVTEVLSLGKRAVIIPRIAPNREQLLRASLFEERGLIGMLHPDRLSPEALAVSIAAALHAPPLPRQRLESVGLDLGGLHQVKANVLRLLEGHNLLRRHPR